MEMTRGDAGGLDVGTISSRDPGCLSRRPLKRLIVSTHEARVGDEAPGSSPALLLAAGEHPEASAKAVHGGLTRWQGSTHGVAVGRDRASASRAADSGPMATNLLERDGKMRGEAQRLRYESDRSAGCRGRRAQHVEPPRLQRSEPEQAEDDGRLAGRLRADEGERLAVAHRHASPRWRRAHSAP